MKGKSMKGKGKIGKLGKMGGLAGVTKMRPGSKRTKLPTLASGGEMTGEAGFKKTLFGGRAQFGR
jgi:hypothetical protein